jgi:hypothetical protein
MPGKNKNGNPNRCYTCKPRGTLKEHIISQTDYFTFNHDLFNRPLIIITSKVHYHTLYDIPNEIKIKLFEDIKLFADFWNLVDYTLVIHNGNEQTHHHFYVKMTLNPAIANRMRRDHFTRINLEKSYLPFNQIESNIKIDEF